MQLIAHLDADCFYVSAERVRHPDLIGKSVGVLGNQGACVIAKSYEMKAAGVKTGEPIWDAVKKCPEGIYVKRDFRWYEVLSRMMLDIVRRFSGRVEYYSIDEFFLEVAACHDPEQFATQIRDAIFAEVDVPATIGVGRSRTLAKLFSDTAKPFGVRVVTTEEQERVLLGQLAVTEISGIAGRRGAKLSMHGIATCLDFANADRRLIRQLLTKTGEDVWWELRGTHATPTRQDRPHHKYISRGGSIGGASANPQVIYAWLVRNTERLVEELEFYEVHASSLQIALAYHERPSAAAAAPISTPTDRFDILLDGGRIGLRRCYRPGWPVTHMHLIAGGLRWRGCYQPGLFDVSADSKGVLADRVKRQVNERFGRFAVRSGQTLFLPEMYRDPSHSFDVCDIRGKMCF
jgi:DNA polymerase V